MQSIPSFEMSDGDVRAWIEQGTSVHLKAVDHAGDPVELNEHELDELISALCAFRNDIGD